MKIFIEKFFIFKRIIKNFFVVVMNILITVIIIISKLSLITKQFEDILKIGLAHSKRFATCVKHYFAALVIVFPFLFLFTTIQIFLRIIK